MVTQTPKETAMIAADAGYCVIPPRQDGSKAPDAPSWDALRKKPLSANELSKAYDTKHLTGVGILTGSPSRGLEVLDFDDRGAWPDFVALCKDSGLLPLLDRVRNGYFEHSPNGCHLLWTCDEPEGNQKLASKLVDGKQKALIETRGEGGYIIIAPTHGTVNPVGDYVLQSGGLRSIVHLDVDEREALLGIARALCRLPKTEREPIVGADAGGRPGDDFNEKATWEQILTPHGWSRLGTHGGITHWRRPGKDIGNSATTGHSGTDALFVFTTSTQFEPGRNYSKFSAYGILNHNGDFRAASSELANQGYGLKSVEAVEAKRQVDDFDDFDGLLEVPGFIGDLADHINKTSHRKQPLLAVGASICAMSNLVAHKVRTTTGLRPNIYMVGVARTSAGKDRARQVVKELFTSLGEVGRVSITGATADTGLVQGVKKEPCSLALMDEFGDVLQGISEGQRSGGPLASLATAILQLFSDAQSTYCGKLYSEKEQIVIKQPCLSIYGTTTPRGVRDNVSERHMEDGLLNRILFLWTSGFPRAEELVGTSSIPGSILDQARAWLDVPMGPVCAPDEIPAPRVVDCTSGALEALRAHGRAHERVLRDHIADGRDDLAGLVGRDREHVAKLAMLRACSQAIPGIVWPTVSEADVDWAAKFVAAASESAIRELGCGPAVGPRRQLVQALVDTLGTFEPCKPVSIGTLSKRVPFRKAREGANRSQIMEAVHVLEDVYGIEVVRTGRGVSLVRPASS